MEIEQHRLSNISNGYQAYRGRYGPARIRHHIKKQENPGAGTSRIQLLTNRSDRRWGVEDHGGSRANCIWLTFTAGPGYRGKGRLPRRTRAAIICKTGLIMEPSTIRAAIYGANSRASIETSTQAIFNEDRQHARSPAISGIAGSHFQSIIPNHPPAALAGRAGLRAFHRTDKLHH